MTKPREVWLRPHGFDCAGNKPLRETCWRECDPLDLRAVRFVEQAAPTKEQRRVERARARVLAAARYHDHIGMPDAVAKLLEAEKALRAARRVKK